MKRPVSRSWQKSKAIIPIVLLLVSTACAQKTVYVMGDSRPIPLNKGQSVPADGWWLSDAAMADLLIRCERTPEP